MNYKIDTDKGTEKDIDYIDIFDLLLAIYKKKMLILLASIFALGMSALYSISLPNIYTSETLLVSNNQAKSMSSMLGSYSMIANIAGVELPGESNTKTQEAIERLKSLEFFSSYILPEVKAEDLFAVSRWDMIENTIIYDENIFDSRTKKWVRKYSPPMSVEPSSQELHKKFLQNFSVTFYKDTGFVSLQYSHKSPYVAKDWLDVITFNINESMRNEDKDASLRSINFLNTQSEKNRIAEIGDVISQLLKSQMETLMLASASDNYVFKVIEKPYVPELKSSPSRSFIVIFGTFLGLILSLTFIIAQEFFKKRSTK
tara:strand:+ start:126 stop:1070 length:945 start_codon:yes stop_codon:yes gene_type:complete